MSVEKLNVSTELFTKEIYVQSMKVKLDAEHKKKLVVEIRKVENIMFIGMIPVVISRG